MSAGLDHHRSNSRQEGDYQEWRHRLHPERCVDHGHPGATFNPWLGQTWCLCGAHQYDGDVVERTATSLGPAHCGGVLSECLGPDQTRWACSHAPKEPGAS